jgi:hypothetical protein
MRNKLILVLYFIFIFFIASYAFKRPSYNWDMLAYMAVVIGYDHNDPNFVHDTVYDIAHRQFLLALTVSLLIMLSAPMWDVVRCSSPDCLSAFLLFSAMYFVLERRSLVVVMLLFIVFSYLYITLSARQFGWNILYYPTFIKSLNLSYSFHPEFHLKDYLALSISHIMTGLFYSNLLLFLALSGLIFIGRSPLQFRRLSFDQLFVSIIIVTIIVRFVLQPVIADRFYIAYYLCILVLLIRRLYRAINISST